MVHLIGVVIHRVNYIVNRKRCVEGRFTHSRMLRIIFNDSEQVPRLGVDEVKVLFFENGFILSMGIVIEIYFSKRGGKT